MRLCLLFLSVALFAAAQQTIFNVPSADITADHDWFYQHQSSVRAWKPDRSWVLTNSFGYGIGHHTELDLTESGLDLSMPGQTVANFGFKSSIPIGHEDGHSLLNLVVGDLVQVRDQKKCLGDWAYAMLNTEVPHSKTRLTAGLSSGTSILFGSKTTGILAGIEQPLSNRFLFQADWFSGHHSLSYAIPGIVYRFQRRWMLSLGYQIPNRPHLGAQSAVLELTRF